MTKSIDFYFDFISPYSYLTYKKLTNNAFEKDIFNAPTLVVNNKIFWGKID